MSDVISPDSPATGTEGAETGGKVSLMQKVKAKTSKLKDKIKKPKSGTPTEGAGENDTSESSSDEEEKEAPVNNAPEYEKKLSEGFTSKEAGGTPSAGTQGEKDAAESGLSKDFQGLSTGDKAPEPESEPSYADKPATEKATDSLYAAKDQVASKFGYGTGSTDQTSGDAPVTESLPDAVKPSEETKGAAADLTGKTTDTASDLSGKAGDTASGLTDKTSEKASELGGKTSETAAQVGDSGSTEDLQNKAADAGKSWSQWAAEKVGYGKDVAAEKLPTTADGTSAPDAAIDKATYAKDVISQKAGEVTGTATAKAGEYQSSIPSDPAKRTYMQHAVTHATTAKDSFITNTTPGEHDKALSEKVTESIGNLPTMLKSSLGFGGSAPTSPSTDSSVTGADAAPQSPSVVGRFTSMFAEKKPPSSGSAAATGEE